MSIAKWSFNISEYSILHGAGLRVLADAETQARIELMTGLVADEKGIMGEVMAFPPGLGKTWPRNYWSIRSHLPKSESLSEHLRELWLKIGPHRYFFYDLRNEGVTMDVFCRHTGDGSGCSSTFIESDAFAIFSELEIDLELSIIA